MPGPARFGMGDVKLIATMGLFLGEAVLGAVLVALLAGSLFGARASSLRDGRAAAKRDDPVRHRSWPSAGSLALLGRIPALQ